MSDSFEILGVTNEGKALVSAEDVQLIISQLTHLNEVLTERLDVMTNLVNLAYEVDELYIDAFGGSPKAQGDFSRARKEFKQQARKELKRK